MPRHPNGRTPGPLPAKLLAAGYWALAYCGAVLATSCIASFVLAIFIAGGELFPFDQVWLAGWYLTAPRLALYGFVPAIALTWLCERPGLYDKSPLIFAIAGALVAIGIAIVNDWPKTSAFDPLNLYAPMTGATGGLVFVMLRRKLAKTDRGQKPT